LKPMIPSTLPSSRLCATAFGRRSRSKTSLISISGGNSRHQRPTPWERRNGFGRQDLGHSVSGSEYFHVHGTRPLLPCPKTPLPA
jgi:hypothetical protein